MNPDATASSEIIATYDIRGNTSTEIDIRLASAIGTAFYEYVVDNFVNPEPQNAQNSSNNKTSIQPIIITMGRDTRPSGETLEHHVVQGIRHAANFRFNSGKSPKKGTTKQAQRPTSAPVPIAAPVKIYKIGECTTPQLCFASLMFRQKTSLQSFGIMITASHNPGQYNGFKFITKDHMGPSKEDIQKILHRAKELRVQWPLSRQKTQSWSPSTSVANINIEPDYMRHLIQNLNTKEIQYSERVKKIGLYHCNGGARNITEQIAKVLNMQCVKTRHSKTVSHPGYDPTATKIREELSRIAKKMQLEAVMAFDGDGDRLLLIDQNGNSIPGDQIGVLMIDLLKLPPKLTNAPRERSSPPPSNTIVIDNQSSIVLKEAIQQKGFNCAYSPTGHSFFKQKMSEENAIFGCEISGHFYFRDTHPGYDDAIYSTIRLISHIAQAKLSLKEYFNKLPKTHLSPPIREHHSSREQVRVKLQKIQKYLESREIPYSRLDGIKVSHKQYWFTIRQSQTEPCLTIRYEAMNDPDAEKVQRLIAHLTNLP